MEKKMDKKQFKCEGSMRGPGSESAIYGLGFVGAVIYYVTSATSFWIAVLGILKALVWPAFLVYGLLKLLGA